MLDIISFPMFLSRLDDSVSEVISLLFLTYLFKYDHGYIPLYITHNIPTFEKSLVDVQVILLNSKHTNTLYVIQPGV